MSTKSNAKGRRDVDLSKTLSWLLRHGALKEGLEISSQGYIGIEKLLDHKDLKGKFTVEDVKRVVEFDKKNRFTLRYNNLTLEICANQGHSLKDVDGFMLTPILNSECLSVIHGTFLKNWVYIKESGLNRMKRNHIHFATGLPHDENVISGMRSKAEVFIYIDVDLAIKNGITFFKSVNGVILSPGNEAGVIGPQYFLKVLDVHGKNLL